MRSRASRSAFVARASPARRTSSAPASRSRRSVRSSRRSRRPATPTSSRRRTSSRSTTKTPRSTSATTSRSRRTRSRPVRRRSRASCEARSRRSRRAPAVSSAVSDQSALRRQDVGTKIKIKPHLNDSNEVRLDVIEEISEVGTPLGGTLGAIPISKRTATTKLVVADQQTVVIGGLIRSVVGRSEEKVPVLGDIPVLGALFRKRTDQNEKRNLILVMTPYIIRDQQDLRTVLQSARCRSGRSTSIATSSSAKCRSTRRRRTGRARTASSKTSASRTSSSTNAGASTRSRGRARSNRTSPNSRSRCRRTGVRRRRQRLEQEATGTGKRRSGATPTTRSKRHRRRRDNTAAGAAAPAARRPSTSTPAVRNLSSVNAAPAADGDNFRSRVLSMEQRFLGEILARGAPAFLCGAPRAALRRSTREGDRPRRSPRERQRHRRGDDREGARRRVRAAVRREGGRRAHLDPARDAAADQLREAAQDPHHGTKTTFAVYILMGDPFDTTALDELRVLFGKPVEASVAPSEKIEDAINRALRARGWRRRARERTKSTSTRTRSPAATSSTPTTRRRSSVGSTRSSSKR